MELEEHLSYLENVRDWQSLVEELEKGIASSAQNADKAQFHLQARPRPRDEVSRGGQGPQALPGRLQAEPSARSRAWRRPGASTGGSASSTWSRSSSSWSSRRAPTAAHARARCSSSLVTSFAIRASGRRRRRPMRVRLGAAAARTQRRAPASRTFRSRPRRGRTAWRSFRARRTRRRTWRRRRARFCVRRGVARRFAPDEAEADAGSRIRGRPGNKQTAALYEGLLAEQGRFDVDRAGAAQGPPASQEPRVRGAMALVFGTRWVLRHQNIDIGARFLEEALKLDPQNEGAFFFLREAYGKKGGDWGRVLISPKKPRPAWRTATARSCSPRPARSRGGSSET